MKEETATFPGQLIIEPRCNRDEQIERGLE